jgi:hypothetical protein
LIGLQGTGSDPIIQNDFRTMSFAISDYLRLRPYAYHLTDSINVSSLASERQLRPVAELLESAGMNQWLRLRRRDPLRIAVEDQCVVLKDQRPLVMANVELAGDWAAGDFVEHLNRHVFFWPGRAEGPIKNGRRLFDAYEGAGSAVLRIPSVALIEANERVQPLFCAFNSGAPRMNGGRRAPRGPGLFAAASTFPRRASEVVELVFRGAVRLPDRTEIMTSDGRWRLL